MVNNNTMKADKGAGAMLGAAFGDALGWPDERIPNAQGRLHELRKRAQRSSVRFHEETVGKGRDDIQLMLCISRALQKGEGWWEHLTHVELPSWSERGGSEAVKRAAKSWLNGVAPWNSGRKQKQYYSADGNGVAVRILPHVLFSGDREFPEIAANIFLDGITTHGHPRALLGALAYGFALWTAFRKDSTLAYGELVEELIKNVDLWSALPDNIPQNWWNQVKLWKSSRAEIMCCLEICQSELSKGALCLDDDVLEKLQYFSMGGAGTIAATASVYLASRHAADPINGVVKAVFIIDSDTNTIASMTGGLLGCIHGTGWLSSVKQDIQDAACIEKNAFQLLASSPCLKSGCRQRP